MQIGPHGFFHLTYCSKIHPGRGWRELFGNLKAYALPLKAKLSPDRPFGLGLRLSAAEGLELLAGDNLERFQAFLDRHGLYVFTLNGFPYGNLDGPTVKAQIFAPDWREEARLAYTLRLIEILRRLLPPGVEGGISTIPLSYKPWIAAGDKDAWRRLTGNLARAAARLLQVQEEEGKLIHLDLEPEPDGLLELSQEVVSFYNGWLLQDGASRLAEEAGISPAEARARLLTHIRVCLDTCHLAVEFEEPDAALEAFSREGIQIGKVQITSGLEVLLPPGPEARAILTRQLEPFTRSPYLHQVIARGENGGSPPVPGSHRGPPPAWRLRGGNLAHPLPHAPVRGPAPAAVLHPGRNPGGTPAAQGASFQPPPGDRDLHLGVASPWPQAGPPGVPAPGIPVGPGSPGPGIIR